MAQPVASETPKKQLDQLIQLSKSWAPYYTKNSYDVFEVTENSLTIETLKENAFYYYNIGVRYNCDIKFLTSFSSKDYAVDTTTDLILDLLGALTSYYLVLNWKNIIK